MRRLPIYIIFTGLLSLAVIMLITSKTSQDNEWILLLGFDRRASNPTMLPDVIQAIRIKHNESEITVISVPRDLYVEGHNYWGRINSLGGLINTTSTVSRNFDVYLRAVSDYTGQNIDKYLAIDMYGLKNIVNALDGISVDVKCPINENFLLEDGSHRRYIFSSGLTFMNGDEALAFSRYRRTGGDLSRISQQHKVMQGIREKFQSVSFFKKVNVLHVIKNSISTNLTLTEEVRLALRLFQLRHMSIKGLVFRNKDARDHTVTNNGQRVITISKEYFSEAINNSKNVFDLGSIEQPCHPGWFGPGEPITHVIDAK